jgi:nucleotide-binding universal stress UspA family protein
VKNVIVGVDGTAASSAALRWAAETVGHDGRIHAVVSVNPWTELLTDALTGDPVSYAESVKSDLIHRWTADAGFSVGTLSTTVSHRPMAAALDRAATTDVADAFVIGAHHSLGGFVKRIGHATNRLIRSTTHPVVVVPTDVEPKPLIGGTVVVGVGHGNATRGAVRWVAHLSGLLRISVELLHARGDAPVFQAGSVADFARYEVGTAERTTWERGEIEHFADLMRTLAGPEQDLAITTPPGLAALRLDEASERCALLVVGRHRSRLDRGHHTAQPLRHVLTHARCPVVVIADRPDEEI